MDVLAKTLESLEYDTIYARGKFVARPDLNNPRKCDSVGEQFPGIMKDGKFQIVKIMSADENYRLTIKSNGMEKIYGLE